MALTLICPYAGIVFTLVLYNSLQNSRNTIHYNALTLVVLRQQGSPELRR